MSYTFNDGADAPVRITAGRHDLQITGWERKFYKTGTPYFEVTTRNLEGAKYSEKLAFHDKVMWRLDLFLKSCGIRFPRGTPITQGQFAKFGEILIGRQFSATLALGKPNETTGKRYLEIVEFHDAPSHESPKIPDEDDGQHGADDDDDGNPF